MKKVLLMLSVFFMYSSLSAQAMKGVINNDDAKLVKEAQFIVVLGNDKAKSEFELGAKNTFVEGLIEDYLVKEKHKVKDEVDGKYYIKVREVKSQSSTSSTPGSSTSFRFVSTGYELVIVKGGVKNALFEVFVPIDKNAGLSAEVVKWALDHMEDNINYVLNNNEQNNKGYFKNEINKRNPRLNKLTLYVNENQIKTSKKESAEDVLKSNYKGKSKVVSYDEFRETILNETEGVAYLMVAPYPIGGSYILRFYIVDAATGETVVFKQPAGVQLKGTAPEVAISGKLLQKLRACPKFCV